MNIDPVEGIRTIVEIGRGDVRVKQVVIVIQRGMNQMICLLLKFQGAFSHQGGQKQTV